MTQVATRSSQVPRVETSSGGHSGYRIWAILGFANLVVAAYVWGRWVLSDNFLPHGVPTGDDPIGWRLPAIYIAQAVVMATCAYMVWRFLIRPLVRDRTLTFDGMFVISGLTCWWWDPVMNYFNLGFVYNSHFVNFGSWTEFMPGMSTPNMDKFPEPVLFIFTAYVWWVLGAALIGCWAMRQMKARWPNMTTIGLCAGVFGIFAVIDLAFELILIIGLQVYVYPAAPKSITLWAGKWYQYCLLYPITAAVLYSPWAWLRYLKDDRGMSFVERGIDNLGVSKKAKKGIQFLAINGFIAVTLLGYGIVSWPLTINVGNAPALPSYLRNGICGEGTKYACPGEHVPLWHGDKSIPIAPDDPRLPEDVRLRQTWPYYPNGAAVGAE